MGKKIIDTAMRIFVENMMTVIANKESAELVTLNRASHWIGCLPKFYYKNCHIMALESRFTTMKPYAGIII